MNTGMMSLMIVISTLLAMGAGVCASRMWWTACFALLVVDLFVLFFGILTPFRYHYHRSRRHYD